MKVYTSYFYQIRFFKPYLIPLSTAVWDPKWFHQGYGADYKFLDKNGVINGLRARPFMPDERCEGLCRGPELCKTKDSNTCAFLKQYYNQLNELDFDETLARFKILGARCQDTMGFIEEPEYALIFHETPVNPCSERIVVTKWFNEHNYDIKEWSRKDLQTV